MRNTYVKFGTAFVALTLAGSLALSACGEEDNDSGRVDVPDDDAFVIAMPDQFTNAAARCFGTDMLYAAFNSNGRALAVSPGHPWCADGVLTVEEIQR